MQEPESMSINPKKKVFATSLFIKGQMHLSSGRKNSQLHTNIFFYKNQTIFSRKYKKYL